MGIAGEEVGRLQPGLQPAPGLEQAEQARRRSR